jgi:LytS/YehU family sensor histidine kinase
LGVSLAIAVFAISVAALASGLTFERHGTLTHGLAQILTNIPAGFYEDILAYWTVICACFAADCYRRYEEGRQRALRLELQAAQLRSQLLAAQVRALRAQLQPRFLFSTMNTIMIVVRQREDEQAEALLDALAAFLRFVLEDESGPEVSVRREIEYLQRYVAIEQLRLRDRIRVEVSAEPETLDAAVACMSLQPIVEHVIQNEAGQSLATVHIRIKMRRVHELLSLEVEHGDTVAAERSCAGGADEQLSHTSVRLKQLYGEACRFVVAEAQDGTGSVGFLIPYHLAPSVAEANLMEAT